MGPSPADLASHGIAPRAEYAADAPRPSSALIWFPRGGATREGGDIARAIALTSRLFTLGRTLMWIAIRGFGHYADRTRGR